MVPMSRLGSPCLSTYSPNSNITRESVYKIRWDIMKGLTIIAQKEFVLIRTEHTHWPAGFATFSQLFMFGIIPLRDSHTLETGADSTWAEERENNIKPYSVRSMISKPFVQRIAIFALRKMRSNDSDGRKKSCSYGVRQLINYYCLLETYPVNSEPLRPLRA